MTTTLQIRAEIETALQFKAMCDGMGLSQGKTLACALAALERELSSNPLQLPAKSPDQPDDIQ